MAYKLNKFIIDQAIKEMQSIQDMLRWTVSQFNQAELYYGHGTDNAWDETLKLILPSLFLSLDFPIECYNSRLTMNERILLIKRVKKRINEHIPVSYLINKAWFCGLEFYVDKNVLIPRSPIGELITNNFYNLLPYTPSYILDMCTGSGCIGIACAYAFPESKIDIVDISIDVLNIAQRNIITHNLENRVTPICSDLFNNLSIKVYDLIVINPPYVDEEDIQNMPLEFHAEPILGLFGGKDGLNLIHRILMYVHNYLTEDGILICEVGNSIVHLKKQYPQIPFHWFTFARGGDGVFMLTCKQLKMYNNII